MATSKEDMQLNYRRFKEGDTSWGSFAKQIFKEDTSHQCPTYIHHTPLCQAYCPTGEDIRGWLDIVRGIMLKGSGFIDILPSVIGLLILGIIIVTFSLRFIRRALD